MVNGKGLGQPSPAVMQNACRVKWCCSGEPAPVLFPPNVESSHTLAELLNGVPLPGLCNTKLYFLCQGFPCLEKAGSPHSY